MCVTCLFMFMRSSSFDSLLSSSVCRLCTTTIIHLLHIQYDTQQPFCSCRRLEGVRTCCVAQARLPAASTSLTLLSTPTHPQDLYKLLVTSLRASSVHFKQLSFDSVTVGLWGLSKAHAAAQIDTLPGTPVAPADRCAVFLRTQVQLQLPHAATPLSLPGSTPNTLLHPAPLSLAATHAGLS